MSHCLTALLFQVFGRANHRSFGEAIFFLNFRFAVSVGKKSGRPHGNRLDLRNFLQNKTAMSRNNINCFAATGFFHQAAQIGFGVAQSGKVREWDKDAG